MTMYLRTSGPACSKVFPHGLPLDMKFSSVFFFQIKILGQETGMGILLDDTKANMTH